MKKMRRSISGAVSVARSAADLGRTADRDGRGMDEFSAAEDPGTVQEIRIRRDPAASGQPAV